MIKKDIKHRYIKIEFKIFAVGATVLPTVVILVVILGSFWFHQFAMTNKASD